MKHYKNPTTGEVFAYETEAERTAFGASELVEMTAAEVAAHLNPAPTPEQLEALLTAAGQARLDAFAQSRGYDDIKSLVTYAGDPDPVFAAEAAVGIQKRSETWAAMRQIKAAVLAGDWPTAGAGQMPQTIGDIEAELPAFVWPA